MAWGSLAQDLSTNWRTLAGLALVLGALLLSGLPMPSAGAAPAFPSATNSSPLAHPDRGAALLAAAAASLARPKNPVSPGATCQISGTSSATCTLSASAPARPASSGPNGDWVDVTKSLKGGGAGVPTPAPGYRYIETMCYDAADGYVLLFGGVNVTTSVMFSDTWTFQNGLWTQLNIVGPSARYGAQMAYDEHDHEVVLFSGQDISTSTEFNDTWTYSGGTWTQLTFTGPTPEARWRGNFAYDGYDGYLLLTGGTGSSGIGLFDTWEFVNNTWTDLLSKVGNGPGIYRGEMVYDAADSEIVLYGGTTSSGAIVTQTWTYQNLKWTQLTLTTAPSARVYSFLSYDPARSAVILFGGSSSSSGGVVNAETWSFSAGKWTKLVPATAPTARGYSSMVYDPVDGEIVLYGGYTNTVTYNDTWEFNTPMVVWGGATPAIIDAGRTTNLQLQVVSKLTNLSYWFTGLPVGCSSQNTTNLSCTPTQYGSFDALGGANDGTGDNASVNITLSVRQDPTVQSVTFRPAVVDLNTTTTITAAVSGGAPPLTYKWTVLPPGCKTANVSVLSCTPNGTGSFPVNVSVRDASGIVGNGSGNLLVNARPSISEFLATPQQLDRGQRTTFYANVSQGTGPYTYVWTNLPYGCTAANVSSITCTPITSGAANYTVQVVASDRFNLSVTGNISLSVNQDPSYTTSGASPVPVDVGIPFQLYMNVSGGSAPFVYHYMDLPPGCTPVGGAVATCSASAAGSYNVTINATDIDGLTVQSTPIALLVSGDPVVGNFSASPSTTDVGVAAVFTSNASLGTGNYTYVYTGLPSGCHSHDTPSIVCTPIVQGHFTVVVTVTDSQGAAGNRSIGLTVDPPPAIASFQANPSQVNVNHPVTFVVSASNGTAPFRYRYGGLPGCASANTANLACTPTSTGTFTVEVTVRDAAGGQATANVTLTVQSGGGAMFLGLPLVEGLGLLIPLILVVAVVGFLVYRRRRRPEAPAPMAEYEDTGPTVEPPP